VGAATALFQSVLFVTFASSLGLPILVAHFAVGATQRAGQVSNYSLWLRSVSGIVAAIVFLVAAAQSALLAPWLAMGDVTAWLTYIALTVGAGLSIVFEARLITLRSWNLLMARSLIVAVARLPLVLLITTDATGDEAVQALFIFAAGPVAASGFLGALWLRFRVDRPAAGTPRRPPDLAHLSRYAGVNWLGLLFTQGPVFMVPVIVAFSVDGSENAPFYVAWSFGAITFLLPQMIGQIVLSEAGQSPSWVELLFRALRLTLVLTTLSAAGAYIGAPIVASVYGEGFESVADHLPLVVGAGIAWSYTSIGLAASRLRERYGDIVLISATFLFSTVLPALVLAPIHGAAAATWSWLAGNCLTAAVTALRYRQWRLDDDVVADLQRMPPELSAASQ
jgi:O-antigen/teichoic acid export membrane protein